MTNLTRHLKAQAAAEAVQDPADDLPREGKDTYVIRPGSRYDLAALCADLQCGRCRSAGIAPLVENADGSGVQGDFPQVP